MGVTDKSVGIETGVMTGTDAVGMVTDVTVRDSEGKTTVVATEGIDVVGVGTDIADALEVTAVLSAGEVKSWTCIGDDRDGDSGSVEWRSESYVSS